MKLPLCSSCGGPNRRRGQRWCHSCHAEHMRETRPKHSELEDAARTRANTRAYTRVLVGRGVLQKQPCAHCGSKQSQAHHPDYSDPRTVVWLCRPCHEVLHVERKECA